MTKVLISALSFKSWNRPVYLANLVSVHFARQRMGQHYKELFDPGDWVRQPCYNVTPSFHSCRDISIV